VLRNGSWRFQWVIVESLGYRVGDFGGERFQSAKVFGVADMVQDSGVFGMGVAPGRSGEAENP